MEITNNNNNKFSFKKWLFKLTFFFVAILIFSSALNTKETSAYFNDSAIISGNSFTAKTLDLSTSSSDLGVVHLGAIQNYNIINQGSLAFEYGMSVELYGGSNVSFCNDLTISVSKDANTLYTGNLMGLNFTKLIGGTQDNLTFIITDPNHNSTGRVCNFNLISKAWQDTLSYDKGFTDIAYSKIVVYSNNVDFSSSKGIVLNEFLPYPDGYQYGFDFGKDNSHMPQGEWVELYNNGDTDKNLTGWYLADKTPGNGNHTPINTDHILVSSPIISAHGWLVVYMNKKIYNNKGDTVRLFDPNNTLVDSYSYENAPGNKSYARIPDGVGEWVDPIPTPGESNVLVPADAEGSGEAKEEIIPVEEEPIITEEEIIESTPKIEPTTEIINTEITDVKTIGTIETVVLEEPIVIENIEPIIEQKLIKENVEESNILLNDEISQTDEITGEVNEELTEEMSNEEIIIENITTESVDLNLSINRDDS